MGRVLGPPQRIYITISLSLSAGTKASTEVADGNKTESKVSRLPTCYCCCLVTKLCPTLFNPKDCQAPLSMEFSKWEHCSGLPFPSPGISPTPGSNLGLLHWRLTLYCLSQQGSPTKSDLLPRWLTTVSFLFLPLRVFMVEQNLGNWIQVCLLPRLPVSWIKQPFLSRQHLSMSAWSLTEKGKFI